MDTPDQIKHNIKLELLKLLDKEEHIDIPPYTVYHNKTILVLSGGGVKGISHIGALQKIYELGHLNNFTDFAGTSVGGLIIALLVIGYIPEEIWEFIKSFEFTKVVSLNILEFASKYGVDDGLKLEAIICAMIRAKNIDPYITLKDLYLLTKKNITFSGVAINEQSIHYISHTNYPEMPLITAIRITTCIPIYFVPIKYTFNDKTTYYVDGGCMDNYPIHLYDDKLNQVLGLYIHKDKQNNINMDNIESYMMLLFDTCMSGINSRYVKGYEDCTINIFVDNISSIDFGIDIIGKNKLYNSGYDAVTES